jgi:hypothetical protein
MPFFSLRFFYVPLAVVTLAGVVFGLGAIFGLGIVGSPAPPSHTGDLNFTSKPKLVDKRADVAATNGRALSPVYPTSPAPAPADEKPAAPVDKAAAASDVHSEPLAHRDQSQAAPSAPADAAKTTGAVTTGAVPRETVASAPPSKPAQTAPVQTARAKVAPAKAASAHANSCDVRGCASAYHSFRESDCTYQPFSGPRRVCEGPPGTHSASASNQRDLRNDSRRQSRKAEPDDDDQGDNVQPLRDDDMDDQPPAPSRRTIVIDPDGDW